MKILHIDIETSPNIVYCWGLFKQNIGIKQVIKSSRVICFSTKWHGSDEVEFYSEYHDGFENMMNKLHYLLSKADAVVHYNGIKFDVPKINWEFLKLELNPPETFHQIDLYRTVRSRFKSLSNKLDYVAHELGLGSKLTHQGFDLWIGCEKNDPVCWETMKQYNMQDVELLEVLYERVLSWIKDHPNRALYVEDDRPLCPNCGSGYVIKKGFTTTKLMRYQRYKCKACGTPIRGRFNIMDKKKKKNLLTQDKI